MRLLADEGRDVAIILALLTEDKDFGQLAFAARARSPGVILLRFGSGDRAALLDALVELLTLHEGRIRCSFVVVSPGRIRLSPSPPAE